jgi:hypothetical protein
LFKEDVVVNVDEEHVASDVVDDEVKSRHCSESISNKLTAELGEQLGDADGGEELPLLFID